MRSVAIQNSSSRYRSAVLLAVLFCVSVVSASAATLENYASRVDSAKRHVDELLDTVAKSELSDRQTQRESDISAEIRKNIPATETIEWKGGSAETANKWLLDELDAFQKEDDSTRRAIILTGISERLTAIDEKVDELQNATSADPTKDRDKQKLAEILRREEYQKPEVKEEGMFQRWWREFWDWFAKIFPRPNITPAAPEQFGSFKVVLQVLIYAVAIGLVGLLIYKFAPFLSSKFGWKTKTKKQDRVILGERIGADESASDLFSDAERLAREGNLRGAIRKGYVAFLCEMADRKLIGLARHKTNRDYMRDMRKNDALFQNMRGLTGNFERNWYGIRIAEPADWEEFRSLYKQTIASTGSQKA